MIILAIETSCDETACAIVENGVKLLAQSLASSAEIHQKFGGVVPEVAARKQVEFIVPVIHECLEKFAQSPNKIDAIAVTVGPGLVGSLVVGIEAAKALAIAWDKPLIPVNHLVGHIYGNFLGDSGSNIPQINFPAVVLIVSGGHTDLISMRGHADFKYLGGTLDDAAGEAFDKTARLLGISKYFGGALLAKKASDFSGKINPIYKLPRPMVYENNFDFSFSGLKTAVKNLFEKTQTNVDAVEQISKEFQDAVVDVLVKKTIKACLHTGAKNLLLGGGVSANTALREKMFVEGNKLGIKVLAPPISLCNDNAIYIASAAFFNQKFVNVSEFKNVVANPSMGIMD